MKKTHITIAIVGLALGVGLWLYFRPRKKKKERVIKEGTFTIVVEEDDITKD